MRQRNSDYPRLAAGTRVKIVAEDSCDGLTGTVMNDDDDYVLPVKVEVEAPDTPYGWTYFDRWELIPIESEAL